MKKVLLTLLLALALPVAAAEAQNIALGERVPEVKVPAWLRGGKPACTASLEQLRAITDKLGAKLHVVVVTRENEEKIAPLLSPFLSRHISVALDTGGRIFSAFNVQYVPFGVLVDSRNRALWMGNSLQLTPEIIEKSSK